jgi:ADP-heptose:LPS heptosyltransferase
MKVRFMQIVDYWVGVPACALLSLVNWAISLCCPSNQGKTCRILFIELSEMGSSIIAYSALKQAAQKYGAENLYFLIFKKNRESVDILEIIPEQNVIVISDRSFSIFLVDTLKVLNRLWRLRIDTVIDMELFSRFTTLLSFLSGASKRVGFHNFTAEGLYRGSLITHPVYYNPHQHMALNFLSQVRALELDVTELPALKENVELDLLELKQVELPETLIRSVNVRLRSLCPALNDLSQLVVLNPDPGDALPIRGWSQERFLNVAEKLLDEHESLVLVVMGLDSAKPYAEAIRHKLGSSRCIDFTGRTADLKEVLALFSMSDLIITNDSGPAHLAALTRIKSIVIFGPETPALYAPLSDNARVLYSRLSCSPCLSAANHRHTICVNNKCLQAISEAEVLEAANQILQGVE